MNTPILRFSEFRDSWKKIKLNLVLETYINKNKDGKFQKNDMLSVSSSAGVVNQMEYKGRSFAGESILPYNILEQHQIVYTKSPLKEYPYGIIKFNEFYTGIVSTLYAVYNIKDGHSGKFIDYYFQLPERLNKYLKPLVNIGAKNDMKVNNDKVLTNTVVFPTHSEQNKIASFLTAVDKKIQDLNKKKNLLEEYKKGVMQKILSLELRFKDDQEKGFPKWQYMNGNLIFETVTDKEHDSDLPILAITQEHGAIPRNLIEYNISVTDKSIESYKVVQEGDFIISLRSFQGGIEYSNYKGICSPAYIILRPFVDIDRKFFKYFFKTENYINTLNKTLEGIRDGKMISYKNFSEVKLPFPSKKEQTKIADFISSVDEKIKLSKVNIDKMETWKKGLLQKMFC